MPLATHPYPLSLRAKVLQARRLVVKVGTAVLTDPSGRFDASHFEALATELAEVARRRELIVVSSGAIALGVEALGLVARPTDLPGKQAAAAVGQCWLMHQYAQQLGRQHLAVGQMLLTHEDFADRRRYLNARQTLGALLAAKAVPVINENDTVSVEEIQLGDNDSLAALVVGLCDAELLVLLSDVEGLFDADPKAAADARLVEQVPEVTPEIEALAGGSRGGLGTGGMTAKVRAARRASDSGALTVIASGRRPGVLGALLRGENVGTIFGAPRPPLRARQRWIAHALHPKGLLVVDDGARDALRRRGSSLLPSGLTEVRGDFDRGEAVEIAGPDGKAFARGLAGYGSRELARLAGVRSGEIERVLGYKYLDEIVHRDDLVLLEET
ncbi:MAG TPA: glutamate 5-kinase [Myxococcales bacterium]|nr:glutamate 5-kinase [Myxococcales bacterium]